MERLAEAFPTDTREGCRAGPEGYWQLRDRREFWRHDEIMDAITSLGGPQGLFYWSDGIVESHIGMAVRRADMCWTEDTSAVHRRESRSLQPPRSQCNGHAPRDSSWWFSPASPDTTVRSCKQSEAEKMRGPRLGWWGWSVLLLPVSSECFFVWVGASVSVPRALDANTVRKPLPSTVQ